MTHSNRPRIGLALGSGSARGWAHIGVIRALTEAGYTPDIICGTSIGALVGAAYAGGHLDTLEEWVRAMTWWDVARFMDVKLAAGGFIEGERLMASFRERVRDQAIEDLPKHFAAVATDLQTGQEVWLQSGSLNEAIRASIALPGLFTPVRMEGRWLVDGGLVNPVPVSLCRAMGADTIIAVNLNGDIVGRHLVRQQARPAPESAEDKARWEQVLERINNGLKDTALAGLLNSRNGHNVPGLFDVLASSINIMQDRITRSRMAGDPPDVLLAPRLRHLGLMEFDRAEEAIAEGRACVERMAPVLQSALEHG